MIVLAAIRADACAQAVLTTATAVADLFDAKLAALHVRQPHGSSPTDLAIALGAPLREVTGSAIDEIIEAASDPEVAALVLGAGGGRRRRDRHPAGHTAIEVITRVGKPVAVVSSHAQPQPQLARILVPLEGTSESSRALADTITLADRRQLEIVVLHVHSPATVPAFADHEPHATAAWEHEFLSRHIAIPHTRVSLERRLGVPADHTIAVAREQHVDLIMLAWGQNLSPGHARVVSRTLSRSDIPLLLVPAGDAVTPTSSL